MPLPAIDTFHILWTPFSSIVLILLTILTILISDAFAEKFITVNPKFMIYHHHDQQQQQSLSSSSATTKSTSSPHPIISILGSSARNSNIFFQESSLNVLPNFWIWYEGFQIREAIRAQADSHMEFLILTIFNAAFATSVVGVTVLTVTMTLAIRAFGIQYTFSRRYFSPLLCLVAFLADLMEDLCLIVIIVSFPKHTHPGFEEVCAWSSFIKFCAWFVLLGWNLLMGLKIVLLGGAKVEHLNED